MSLCLFRFNGEIDRLRDAAANTEYIVSRRKVTEFDLIVIGDRDHVPIRVQQLQIDPLVAVILIDLCIEPATSKRKRNLD